MIIYGKHLYKGNGVFKNRKEAARYFHMAANQGNIECIYKYGVMLYKGDGIPQNIKESIVYFKKLSKNYTVESLYFIGKMMLHGLPNKSLELCSTKHQIEAFNLIKKAAKMGNIKANYVLGSMYFYGYIVHDDIKKAVKYLKIAADNDHVKATFLYLNILQNYPEIRKNESEDDNDDGESIILLYYQNYFSLINHNPFLNQMIISDFHFKYYKYKLKDKDYMEKIFIIEGKNTQYCCPFKSMDKKYKINHIEVKISADEGNVDSMYEYGQLLKNGNGPKINKKEACKYFKMAAEKNDKKSMFEYGIMLFEGDGIKQNKEEGIKYIKKSADLEYEKAMLFYAKILNDGDGIESNKQESIEYFKKAAEKGDSESMFIYGNMLLNGDGIEKNIDEGISYIKSSAKFCSNNDAMLQYGLMLYNGDKVQMKKTKAAKYLEKLVDKTRNETAMIKLAHMLKNGDGIQINKKKSIYYFRLLSELGNEDAMYEYVKLSIDEKIESFNLYDEGFKYLKISADCGNVNSMLLYGKLLLNLDDKKELEKDGNDLISNNEIRLKEAEKYLKMAADLGNEEALICYSSIKQKNINKDDDYIQ